MTGGRYGRFSIFTYIRMSASRPSVSVTVSIFRRWWISWTVPGFMPAIPSRRGPRRTYFYYVCQTRHGGQKWFARQKGIELQPCGMPFVRADAVEEAAWRALETVLISPQIVFDQVGSPSHQIALLEKELQGIEQERVALAKRQSRLLDLYERAECTLLEELDARM